MKSTLSSFLGKKKYTLNQIKSSSNKLALTVLPDVFGKILKRKVSPKNGRNQVILFTYTFCFKSMNSKK